MVHALMPESARTTSHSASSHDIIALIITAYASKGVEHAYFAFGGHKLSITYSERGKLVEDTPPPKHLAGGIITALKSITCYNPKSLLEWYKNRLKRLSISMGATRLVGLEARVEKLAGSDQKIELVFSYSPHCQKPASGSGSTFRAY